MARIALVHDVAGVAAAQAEILCTAGHEVDEIDVDFEGPSGPARQGPHAPAAPKCSRGL